jgi:protein phosphatase 2C family protein 2/3
MQGWRISMEDADTTVLDMIPSPSDEESKTHTARLSFFGVFDGHGGDKVATFCGNNMQNIILRQESFKKGNYTQGLKDGFLAVDRAMLGGAYFVPCDAFDHPSKTPKADSPTR